MLPSPSAKKWQGLQQPLGRKAFMATPIVLHQNLSLIFLYSFLFVFCFVLGRLTKRYLICHIDISPSGQKEKAILFGNGMFGDYLSSN